MTIISKMWRQLGEKILFLLLFLLNFEVARQRKYKLLQVSCHCCGANAPSWFVKAVRHSGCVWVAGDVAASFWKCLIKKLDICNWVIFILHQWLSRCGPQLVTTNKTKFFIYSLCLREMRLCGRRRDCVMCPWMLLLWDLMVDDC